MSNGREADTEARLNDALRFIERRGYWRCDIPACNCNSWHGGNAELRLDEIAEELGDETQGKTLLQAVKDRRKRNEPS